MHVNKNVTANSCHCWAGIYHPVTSQNITKTFFVIFSYFYISSTPQQDFFSFSSWYHCNIYGVKHCYSGSHCSSIPELKTVNPATVKTLNHSICFNLDLVCSVLLLLLFLLLLLSSSSSSKKVAWRVCWKAFMCIVCVHRLGTESCMPLLSERCWFEVNAHCVFLILNKCYRYCGKDNEEHWHQPSSPFISW